MWLDHDFGANSLGCSPRGQCGRTRMDVTRQAAPGTPAPAEPPPHHSAPPGLLQQLRKLARAREELGVTGAGRPEGAQTRFLLGKTAVHRETTVSPKVPGTVLVLGDYSPRAGLSQEFPASDVTRSPPQPASAASNPTAWRRAARHREAKRLAPGHTASERMVKGVCPSALLVLTAPGPRGVLCKLRDRRPQEKRPVSSSPTSWLPASLPLAA